MIVVDTSALCAILFLEDGADAIAAALADAPSCLLSAANWVETAIVVEAKKGADGALELDALLERAGVEIVPVTDDVARAARIGWRRFGKGRHPACLNFGDCFAYGLAVERGLPLLATGRDFMKTDLELAVGGAR